MLRNRLLILLVLVALATSLVAVAPTLAAPPAPVPPTGSAVCHLAGRLSIEGTPKTPTISFDLYVGVLTIKGRSIPENSTDFYRPLVDSLARYAHRPAGETFVNVYLVALDQGSRKAILDVFKKLEAIHKGGSAVTVLWHYDEGNKAMLEAGEDYQAIINVPFKMVQVEE